MKCPCLDCRTGNMFSDCLCNMFMMYARYIADGKVPFEGLENQYRGGT